MSDHDRQVSNHWRQEYERYFDRAMAAARLAGAVDALVAAGLHTDPDGPQTTPREALKRIGVALVTFNAEVAAIEQAEGVAR